MITVDDIIHHIAQQLLCGSVANRMAAIHELIGNYSFDLQICITSDVEESESFYLEHFGRAYTFYFRLKSFAHGEQLAGDLFQLLKGRPDIAPRAAASFLSEAPLYLFIHLRNIALMAPNTELERAGSDLLLM